MRWSRLSETQLFIHSIRYTITFTCSLLQEIFIKNKISAHLLLRLFGFLFIIKSHTLGISISSSRRSTPGLIGVGSSSPTATPSG